MRVLGVDYGRRRIGLALSDGTGVLARPWQTLAAGATPRDSAVRLAALLDEWRKQDDDAAGIAAVVVGLPRRLNGEDNEQTPAVRAFTDALAAATSLPVHLQDERLTSHEADARLAERERDWRRRKARLDAAAAAIILQDFLDSALGPAARRATAGG